MIAITNKHYVRLINTGALLSLFMFCSIRSAYSTCVVTLLDRKNHRIVIGSDSLIVGNKGSRNACKIMTMSNCAFVAAGVYNLNETNFHLLDLAESACRNHGNIREKADYFLTLAKEPSEKAISYLRIHAPEYYSDVVFPEFASVTFAGLEAFGYLSVSARAIRVDGKGNITHASFDESDNMPNLDPLTGNFASFGGADTEIKAYLGSHKKIWRENDFADIAKLLVQIEIDAHPKDIGPPISVMEINRDGVSSWIERGLCDQPRKAVRKKPGK